MNVTASVVQVFNEDVHMNIGVHMYIYIHRYIHTCISVHCVKCSGPINC